MFALQQMENEKEIVCLPQKQVHSERDNTNNNRFVLNHEKKSLLQHRVFAVRNLLPSLMKQRTCGINYKKR